MMKLYKTKEEAKKEAADNRQMAFDYVGYMMVGSNFKKCECETTLREHRLAIRYKEMKEKEQFLLEDMWIKAIDKFLVEELPEELWQEPACFSFAEGEKDEQCKLVFETVHYVLELTGGCTGKNRAEVYCKLHRLGKSGGFSTVYAKLHKV